MITPKRILAAAERKTEEIGKPMNIAVEDTGGNLAAQVRMDKAWVGSIDIAITYGLDFASLRYFNQGTSGAVAVGRLVLWNTCLQSRAGHDLRGWHSAQAR
jgi:uncharacterized protein GlcG (DUF336 family)